MSETCPKCKGGLYEHASSADWVHRVTEIGGIHCLRRQLAEHVKTIERCGLDFAAIEKALNGESSDALCLLACRAAAQRAENKQLRGVVMKAWGFLEDVHDLNPDNYTHEEVYGLNEASITAWRTLQDAIGPAEEAKAGEQGGREGKREMNV